MAVYDQLITTYSDTTPHMRAVSNVIQTIDPRDTPLLDELGIDSVGQKFMIKEDSTKIELLEDAMVPLSGTANWGTTITTTATLITVVDASVFKIGHVVLMDSEKQIVSAVDKTNNTITLYSRTYGTAATHATDVTITIVGMARLDGATADFGAIVDITAPYNYTSIFQEGIKVAGSMQNLDQYAIADEFAYQADKQIPHLLRLLERSFFYAVRAAGSATSPRSMGGVDTFIGSNTVAAGGAIAKADFDGLMEQCYLDGGYPDLLVCNPAVGTDIRALIDSSSFVRVDQENTKLGMQPVTRVVTQYGDLKLLVDRHCPVATAYVLQKSKVGFYTYRPFVWKRLGLVGDDTRGEVVGEFSLLVANDLAHGTITGITS